MNANPTLTDDNPAISPECPAPQPEDRAEARVGRRLQDLENLRVFGMQVASRLSAAVAMQLPEAERKPFEQVRDPAVSFARLSRAIMQIVALEEQIDFNRATRMTEAGQRRDRERRRDVERGVRDAAIKDKPDITNSMLATLLNDLNRDYSLYDDLRTGTPAEVVERVCADLGIAYDAELWDDSEAAAPEPVEPEPVEPEPTVASAAEMVATIIARLDASAAGKPFVEPPPNAYRVRREPSPHRNGHDPPR